MQNSWNIEGLKRQIQDLQKYREKNVARQPMSTKNNTQQVSYSYTHPETNMVEIRHHETPIQIPIRIRKPIFPKNTSPKTQQGYEFIDLSQQWHEHCEEQSKIVINNLEEKRQQNIQKDKLFCSLTEDLELEKALEEKSCCGLFSFWR